MGLRMYSSSSPPPTAARKPDPTAGARSPIRRAPSRLLSTRQQQQQRRQSTNAESLFLSSQSSPQPDSRDASIGPYSVPGNYSAPLSPVDIVAPEQSSGMRSADQEEAASTLPFVHHTGTIAHRPDAPFAGDSTRMASATTAESTRRMQVTRQRPTRRASLEAEMGRFVVRPILTDDDAANDAPPPRTAPRAADHPMEIAINMAQRAINREYPGVYPGSFDAGRAERRRQRIVRQAAERARSRSPQRASTAPRIAPPNPTDGLGDRRRSPSVEAEESDWEMLRVTIPPDAQLPSATSSFTSASASSSSSDAQTASVPSSATTSAASSFITNHRYVLPTAECLDITAAQRECGVVCDDARDAQPPFSASRAPSRTTTREPSADRPRRRRPSDTTPRAASADRPRTRRRSSLPVVGGDVPIDASAGRSPHPLAFSVTAQSDAGAADETNASEAESTAPAHLRLPTPSEPAVFDFYAMLRAHSADRPASASTADALSAPLQSPPPPEPSATLPALHADAGAAAAASLQAPTRVSRRLAEVHLQWHQLRRINDLLACGREVPGWLWEVAGLAPELQVREFEI